MRKTILFICLLVGMMHIAYAQTQTEHKFFQRVSVGAIFGMVGSTDFSNSEKPFVISYDVMPNILVITPKTYHNVFYGISGNSVNMLNGYFLKKKWDTYLLYSKSLSTDRTYLGYGIEKMFTAGELKTFLFTEIGTNFKGSTIFSIGLLISAQHKIWQRKGNYYHNFTINLLIQVPTLATRTTHRTMRTRAAIPCCVFPSQTIIVIMRKYACFKSQRICTCCITVR